MIHEVTADDIPAIAETGALHAIGQEEDPRVLDAAGGQHIVTGAYLETDARQGLSADTADFRC